MKQSFLALGLLNTAFQSTRAATDAGSTELSRLQTEREHVQKTFDETQEFLRSCPGEFEGDAVHDGCCIRDYVEDEIKLKRQLVKLDEDLRNLRDKHACRKHAEPTKPAPPMHGLQKEIKEELQCASIYQVEYFHDPYNGVKGHCKFDRDDRSIIFHYNDLVQAHKVWLNIDGESRGNQIDVTHVGPFDACRTLCLTIPRCAPRLGMKRASVRFKPTDANKKFVNAMESFIKDLVKDYNEFTFDDEDMKKCDDIDMFHFIQKNIVNGELGKEFFAEDKTVL